MILNKSLQIKKKAEERDKPDISDGPTTKNVESSLPRSSDLNLQSGVKATRDDDDDDGHIQEMAMLSTSQNYEGDTGVSEFRSSVTFKSSSHDPKLSSTAMETDQREIDGMQSSFINRHVLMPRKPMSENSKQYTTGITTLPETIYSPTNGERAKAIFVTRWLLENYETAEGHSLPRSDLYGHYLDHCNMNGFETVNAASFGKLLRGVFLDIKTRRLGMRGQSKYHYCGIRPRDLQAFTARSEAASAAVAAVGYGDELAAEEDLSSAEETSDSGRRPRQSHGGSVKRKQAATSQSSSTIVSPTSKYNVSPLLYNSVDPPHINLTSVDSVKSSSGLPDFPPITVFHLPVELDPSHVKLLVMMSRGHAERLYDSIVQARFFDVETVLKHFWFELPSHIHGLFDYPEILNYIVCCDRILYDASVNALIPDVIQRLPIGLIQSLRQFSRQFEQYMNESLVMRFSQSLRHYKLAAARHFGQKLRRYSSVNHLAQAAANVLESHEQAMQMIHDFSKIDLENVRSQAVWATECDVQEFIQLESDFRYLLQSAGKLEQFTQWLRNILNRFVDNISREFEEYQAASRRFLLRWKFYCSLVMRELTLRSASSFGSFHLIHLLFDDYLFFLIEQRLEQYYDALYLLDPTRLSNSPTDPLLGLPKGALPTPSFHEALFLPSDPSGSSIIGFPSATSHLTDNAVSTKSSHLSSNQSASSSHPPREQQNSHLSGW